MIRIIMISLSLLYTFCFSAEEQEVDSKVVSATVFKDRAMVTRSAEVNFSKGIHTLIFSHLTNDLQNETVQVSTSGPGMIKILDIRVERRFTTDIQYDTIRKLQDKIDSIKVRMQITMDNLAVYESKKSFVDALKAESLKYMNQKMLISPTTSREWNEMLGFIENNLNSIYKGIRNYEQEKKGFESKIQAIEMEINQAKGGKSQNFKNIYVKIETSTSGKVTVNPSYIVSAASWYPLYDARVSSQTKEIELSYYAMVRQSTGEDWRDIGLTFSTADPMSVKSLPELDRWFLNINPLPVKRSRGTATKPVSSEFKVTYDQNWGLPAGTGAVSGYVIDKLTGEPLAGANIGLQSTFLGSSADIQGKFYIANVPAGRYTLEVQMIGFSTVNVRIDVEEKHIANIDIPLQESAIESEAIMVTADKIEVKKDQSSSIRNVGRGGRSQPERPVYTDVHARELSTSFELKTKNSIPSDNTAHKVTIAIDPLPIDFEYTAIPKIISAVYLKGKVINENSYPLLEGELNVFVDNDFINRTALNTIVPNDTMELALGIDESIKCERIMVNKYVESVGLMGGSKRITYEYEIHVTNNRQTEEDIWIYDQLPIPMNENIKIELLEPDIKESELDNDQKLSWHLNLLPGANKIIPLKFKVQFPKNTPVYGLE